MTKSNFTFRIPADLRQALKDYADGLGITQSAALILILRKFFADLESQEKGGRSDAL